MRLLLDTCIVYDWLMGEIKDLPIIERIQGEGALVSSVTVWEMAIKNGLGKMPLPSEHIAEDIEAQGFQWLNITPYHAQTVLELGDRHKDPFDRLLIAQARYEKLCIVTYDGVFQDYLESESYHSLMQSSNSMVFHLSCMFLATRNFATCYSFSTGQPIFSRKSPLLIDRKLPITNEIFDLFARARILSTRGYGPSISEAEVNIAKSSAPIVLDWMRNLSPAGGTL